MHVTDLAINKTMGIRLAPAGASHLLELPESLLLLNHVGTVHASVQFALAEACSGEFLLSELGQESAQVLAVLRTSEVKFRKPAQGALRASARFAEASAAEVFEQLAGRGRAIASVFIEVSDAQGVVTMTGQYDWFLQKQTT
jgi:acyl-coenzyme A thioesterase PaaI-like protein